MGTIAITGAAGGIGAATVHRLEAAGHRVVGIDIRGAEVIADLSTETGRAGMVEEVTELAGGVLDGLVAGAGRIGGDDGLVLAVNLFGAVATLSGLRPLLARGERPSAIAISSNSTTAYPGLSPTLVDALLERDEAGAGTALAGHPGAAYPASKLALARWVRRAAVGPEWAGAGIRLNAVAPGVIETPMTEGSLDMILGLGDVFPVPQGRAGTADEVAGLLTYLLSSDAAFFCGSVLFMDGGTDAALRADDWPAPL